MADKNEFDELFGDAPKSKEKTSGGARPAPVKGTFAPEPAAVPEEDFAALFGEEPAIPQEKKLSAQQPLGAAGAAAGALYGARKTPSADSFIARRLERRYGLPPGALATLEAIQTPNAPIPTREAAALTAQRLAPPAAPPLALPPVAAPSEPPLSGMQRWANSQTGPASQLAPAVVNELTSTYAGDPSGAPQTIQQQAARTRLARELVPTSALQTSPGGILFTESPRAQREHLLGITPAQRLEAMDRAMAAPMEPRAPAAPATPATPATPAAPAGPTARNIQRAAGLSQATQRGVGAGMGGLFGMGAAMQGYEAATQQPMDWQKWLSLGGNLAGAAGAVSSKVPQMVRGVPVLGPLATLAQMPYLIKNREALMRALTMGDVMPPAVATGAEMFDPAVPR